MELDFPPFLPRFPWLGGDLQTIRNTLLGDHRRLVADLPPAETLLLPTEDGPDSPERLLARLHRGRRAGPLAVLIHGLTGSESSPHMLRTAHALTSRGHSVLRLNLRGAGPGRAYSRDIYHGGRTGDLKAALSALPSDAMRYGIVPIGYSLGGAALLKFLGEGAGGLPLRAAITVSAPIDLAATSRHFLAARNRLYHYHLLRQMLREARLIRLSAAETAALAGIRSVWEFDDRFIAPRFGFDGAEGYYAQSSAMVLLDRITVPTLLIHAEDDPWVPVAPYRGLDWSRLPKLHLALTRSGGHVGFHIRDGWESWHDRRIVEVLDRLSESASDRNAKSPGVE